MSSIFDKNLAPEFESVKDDDETILWAGKPKFTPYLFNGLGLGAGALIFFIACYFSFRGFQEQAGVKANNFQLYFGLIPVAFFLFGFLKKILSYSNTSYVYTNKRVMMRTGFIGTDFKSIDYDKISDIEVTVNFVERAFNVGSIRFFSGRTQENDGTTTKLYDKWEAIPDPYGVFKKVKQVSVDIKTDYNYPNALRPETNPGYNTKYNRPE